MQNAPAAIRGQAAVEYDHGAVCQKRIARVLFCPNDHVEWDFIVLSIEVTGNGNQRGGVGSKKFFE